MNLDGRSFVMIPNSDWSKTQLYAIEGDAPTPGMIIPGWSYIVARVQ